MSKVNHKNEVTFIVDFEHILTASSLKYIVKIFSRIFLNLEQVIASWVLSTPLWKDQKNWDFFMFRGVYRDRPRAWNVLTCFHDIFEATKKSVFELHWGGVMFSWEVFINIFEVLKSSLKTIRTAMD